MYLVHFSESEHNNFRKREECINFSKVDLQSGIYLTDLSKNCMINCLDEAPGAFFMKF